MIRAAMAGEGVVGMGRVVLANRERPIIVAPLANGIIGTTLRYAHEVRDTEDYFADIPELELPEELLDVARHLIRTKTGEFDRAWLEDRYRTVIVEKLKAKAGELRNEVSVGVPSSQNVIDLMAVLKRSLKTEQSSREDGKEGRRTTVKEKSRPARQLAAAAAKPAPTKRSRDTKRR